MINLASFAIFTLIVFFHDSIFAGEGKPADWLIVSMGTLPIIIAAPHGGREPIPGIAVRRGAGVPQFATQRDNNTTELAETFVARLGASVGAKPFLVVARFERKYVDANRPQAAAFESPEAKPYYDAYHAAMAAAVAEVRSRWGGGLLLDIHGQGAEPDMIFRGTDNGRSVTALERRFGKAALTGPLSILGHMRAKGYAVEPGADDRERRYTGGYTTRTYGSHAQDGIDAIQLEFGTNLRAKASLERTANDLAHAVDLFIKSYLPAATITKGVVRQSSFATPRSGISLQFRQE